MLGREAVFSQLPSVVVVVVLIGGAGGGDFISSCTLKTMEGGNLTLSCASVSVPFTKGTAKKYLFCMNNKQRINASDDCLSHQGTFHCATSLTQRQWV